MPDTVCKTIQQYNAKPIPDKDMGKLLGIAADCREVKNYVYSRYGGIGSLGKLYPGYTIQNEMTASGLRQRLGLPSVYFYLAMFDALGDIKAQWTRTKSKVLEAVGRNEGFSEDEKHYLRFLLKVSNAFGMALNRSPIVLRADIQKQYEAILGTGVDEGKLQNYLRRQVRKHHASLHTRSADGFPISEKAYRYGDHGISIATKEKRRRVFIPLTDSNRYQSQMYVKLYPERHGLEIKAPVDVRIHAHAEYVNHVGLAAGVFTMLTTDGGARYGERLGEYQTAYADWLMAQARSYRRNKAQNPGRKKYTDQKRRKEEQMHSYINQELNRFLRTEKPRTVYIPKLPKPGGGGVNKRINHSLTLWQRGYIRKRLTQKCREQSVEVVEVLGKDISNACSICGAIGEKSGGVFTCGECGYRGDIKENAARNAKKRGMEERS